MPAPQPRIHGITHRPGGPDPIPGSSAGIQFDTDPQEGNWLWIKVVDSSVAGGSSSGDAFAVLDDNGGGIALLSSSDGTITISATGGGEVVLESIGATGEIRLNIASGAYLRFVGLPTSNPGGTGRVWNNGGVLNIT
jgi:hypothetical protein